MDGQIASSTVGTTLDESVHTDYLWDGLALLKRGTTEYVNEPAVTGGNPILANGKMLFNDMLGNSLGVAEKDKFTAIQRSAFGQTLANPAGNDYNLFTGKPQIGGLGYAFLFRNYRPNLGKWQTQDPIAIALSMPGAERLKVSSEFMASLGYPDGWNNLAYGNNAVTSGVDYQGTGWVFVSMTDTRDNNVYYTTEVFSTPTSSGYTGTYTITSYQYYYKTTYTDEQYLTKTIRDVFYSIKRVTTVVKYYNQQGVLYDTDYSDPVESDGPIGILTRNYVWE